MANVMDLPVTPELLRHLWAVALGEMPREVLADFLEESQPYASDPLLVAQVRGEALYLVAGISGRAGSPVVLTMLRSSGSVVRRDLLSSYGSWRWMAALDEEIRIGQRTLYDCGLSLGLRDNT